MKKWFIAFATIITGYLLWLQFIQHSAQKDLIFVHETILHNHPGPISDQDPTFKTIMQEALIQAKQEINSMKWSNNHIYILQNYLNHFNDSHLRIFSKRNISQSTQNTNNQNFIIKQLDNQTSWVTLPTFCPNDQQTVQLNDVIKNLPKLQNQKCIIFDLRNNTGGNSLWATNILKALFEEPYVNQQLYYLYKNQTTHWRVSNDNIKHLEQFSNILDQNFGSQSPITLWCQQIHFHLKKAKQNNQPFFIEHETSPVSPSTKIKNSIDATIIIIIDSCNVSAALDFITELKAITKNILFIGRRTDADTIYMEVRSVKLPSGQGSLQIPIKMYHNRPRKNNEHYIPDIEYNNSGPIPDLWIKQTIKF